MRPEPITQPGVLRPSCDPDAHGCSPHPFPRRRLRRCERGFVLPLTLGISTVLAIVGTTAISYTTSGARTASRSTADQKAYALAEAGVNDALAVLALPSNDEVYAQPNPPQGFTG